MSRAGPMSKQILMVKAGAVALGILILVVAAVLGFLNVSDDVDQTDLENAMDDFLQGLSTYQPINAYQEPLVNHFDVIKLNQVTSGQIYKDLEPAYDFIIEIFDVSQYPNRYSFTEDNGTSFKIESQTSYGTTLSEQRVATLVVGEEQHAAILRVTLRT
jgi:hypothetical protein